MAESVTVTAPATSANLGPGFDVLAVALDLTNSVTVTRRPGPFVMTVTGEGSDELACDETNLVCTALREGLDSLDDLHVECDNRIPLGRGLGSSAATICAGLVAANALGRHRWAPDDVLARAERLEGHADNAAACIEGGIVAVAPGPRALKIPTPEGLLFLAVIPSTRISTDVARQALPPQIPHQDASFTLSRAIGLTLALERGQLDEVGAFLEDRLHEPYRGPLIPGLDLLRTFVDGRRCLGVTISGSGPTVLMWCPAVGSVELQREVAMTMGGAGHDVDVRALRIAPGGVRARWTDTPPTALARAIG